MRKLLLSAVLGVLGLSVNAQNYTPRFTHTSGTQVYNTVSPAIPISVTVSAIGTPGFTAISCNAGPYYLAYDAAHKGGYRYDFSPSVTHAKFEINELHDNDTIFIRVNNPVPGVGPITPITLAMLSDFDNLCTSPTTYTSGWYITKGAAGKAGRLTAPYPGYNTGNNTVTLTYGSAPGVITSIELVHPRDSALSSGIAYSAFAALDSCKQPFVATADSPFCSGRSLKLHVPNFPNSTFNWTTTSTTTMTPSQASLPDPTFTGLTFPGSTGWYIATAQRGTCSYIDSIYVDVDLSPITPTVVFLPNSPLCAGDDDTISVRSSTNTSIWLLKPGATTPIKASFPPFFNQFDLLDVGLKDVGTYKAFAISFKGCPSDTTDFFYTINSVVDANFEFTTKLGCVNDTVEFTDLSLGNNQWTWDFNDLSPILSGNDPVKHGNPTHIFNSQGTFQVKLIVSNSKCTDSLIKPVVLNHPLLADFNMNDVLGNLNDSICQGDTIFFENLATATPATSPQFVWDFKDGSPTSTAFEPYHKYTKFGVYPVTLTITDYLKCTRTATKTLVVDSLGSASFFSDTVLCTGETIQFQGDYSLIGGTFARWNFGDGHTIQDEFRIQHAYDRPGTYDVQLEAHYRICKDTTYHQNVYVIASPTVDLGPDTAICPNGDPIALKDLVNDPAANPTLKWRWNTETKDSTANIIVHHPGSYSVTVDNQGCTAADTVVIKKNCYIDIPNVFTPNGDGYNDYFLPRQFLSRNVTKFNMTIYNRWGAVVFETDNINGRGWDGKLNDKDQPQGVYIYLIKVSFGNKTNENYQGNITLLR